MYISRCLEESFSFQTRTRVYVKKYAMNLRRIVLNAPTVFECISCNIDNNSVENEIFNLAKYLI